MDGCGKLHAENFLEQGKAWDADEVRRRVRGVSVVARRGTCRAVPIEEAKAQAGDRRAGRRTARARALRARNDAVSRVRMSAAVSELRVGVAGVSGGTRNGHEEAGHVDADEEAVIQKESEGSG